MLHDLCHKYPEICGRVFQRRKLVEIFCHLEISQEGIVGTECLPLFLFHILFLKWFFFALWSLPWCTALSWAQKQWGQVTMVWNPQEWAGLFLNELTILALCYNEMKLTNILDLGLSDCLRNKDWHQNKGVLFCASCGEYMLHLFFLKLQAIHTLFETDLKTCINTFK